MTNISGWHMTNYNGTLLSNFGGGFFHGQFNNYTSITAFVGMGPETKSDQVLWGGPLVVSPAGYYAYLNFSTNGQKDLVLGIGYNGGGNSAGNKEKSTSLDISYKMGDKLRLSISPTYSINKNIVQYYPFTDETDVVHEWGVPQLDQNMVSTSFRLDYTLYPVMSFQSYIQPFIWEGIYSDFKKFAKYDKYEFDRFPLEDASYTYKSLIFNTVFRWEYKPGSAFYFVWTRNVKDNSSETNFDVVRNTVDLLKSQANNNIAIKLTYWMD